MVPILKLLVPIYTLGPRLPFRVMCVVHTYVEASGFYSEASGSHLL